jgi:hypothetical protein
VGQAFLPVLFGIDKGTDKNVCPTYQGLVVPPSRSKTIFTWRMLMRCGGSQNEVG